MYRPEHADEVHHTFAKVKCPRAHIGKNNIKKRLTGGGCPPPIPTVASVRIPPMLPAGPCTGGGGTFCRTATRPPIWWADRDNTRCPTRRSME